MKFGTEYNTSRTVMPVVMSFHCMYEQPGTQRSITIVFLQKADLYRMSKHGEVTDFQDFKIPGVTFTAMFHSDGRNWNHFNSPVCFLSTLMLQDSGCFPLFHLHFTKQIQLKISSKEIVAYSMVSKHTAVSFILNYTLQ